MNNILIDLEYVQRLGPQLAGFKHLGGNRWACRCPYCGDSKKNKNKMRGGFYEKKGKINYGCYNCSVGTTLGKILEYVNVDLYNEYKFAKYLDNKPVEPDYDGLFKKASHEMPTEEFIDDVLAGLPRLDTLEEDHPAIVYLNNRAIPVDLRKLFYFSPKFKRFTNGLVKDKFDKDSLKRGDYPRLIIPFFNEHGKMFAFAARAFGGEEPKYFIIKIDDNEEKIYGRERVNYKNHILVVEGQIDSMLLPNCVSVGGSDFDTPFVRGIKTNCTLVPDNEPRNPQIVKLYKKYIMRGYNVCMLPETFKFKDINEAIQGGMTQDEIVTIIKENTHHGLMAEVVFLNWKKTDLYK